MIQLKFLQIVLIIFKKLTLLVKIEPRLFLACLYFK